MESKRRSLGTPPTPHDTRNTLSHPEHAPTAPTKIDRRTLRNTGRTAQLNIPVSPEFREYVRKIARQDRLTAWQLFAVAMKAYEKLHKKEKESMIEEVVKADPAASLSRSSPWP